MIGVPSILPQLFDWAFWVPLFFRLFLAFQLYREAKRLMATGASELTAGAGAPTPSAKKALAWALVALSFLFFIGLGVQIIGAIAFSAYLVRFVQVGKKPGVHPATKEILLLSGLVALSLIFLGPGPYAIDLPL